MSLRTALRVLAPWVLFVAVCGTVLADATVPTAPSTAATTADPLDSKSDTALHWADWSVVGGYFLCLLALTWYSVLKNRDTADDYFLAGRNLGWFVVAASIFSSNIGSEHLVGLAGSGCTDGVAMAHYELHAWCLLVLAWVFVPFYARSLVYTMPEFLERRFSPNARYVLSIISLVAYVVTKLAVGIFAGGIVFSILLPEINLNLGFMTLDAFWVGSIAVVVMTGAYTVIGGLRAVAYTDTLQTIIFIAGSAMVTVYGLAALGGWGALREVCGSDMFNLWKPMIPAGLEGTWLPVKDDHQIAWYFNDKFPWLGMLVCAPIVGLWYWCTDQYIVQRALAARNETVARRGSICAGFMKLLPVFVFIVPGMICFALATSNKSPQLREELFGKQAAAAAVSEGKGVRPAGSDKEFREKSQAAFPLMVKHILPPGVRGLVVAGLLSALMSSLAGAFNACSTLFTMDLYQKFRPKASQHQLVWIGRIATTAMVFVALVWIPVIQGQKGLYFYLQAVQGYLAPPIFVVFFLGVFFKRLNAKGCLAALLVGFALGVFRLAVDTPVLLAADELKDTIYQAGSFLWIVNHVYFQYYSVFIALVCAAVMIVVSYATVPPTLERISGLTYGTMTEEQRRTTRNSWNWGDVAASAMVLVVIAAAYVYFTG
jgi:SSS family solute:Na+ symporter